MAIDWNSLFDLRVDELSDERLEALYEELIQFNPKDENNIQRLRKLLELSQSVLQIKSVQAEVAIEEMKETAKRFDKNEIEILRKELEIFKKSDPKGENIALKLSEANDVILDLKNTIEAKESENIKMKRKFNEMQNSFDFKEKELNVLRTEVESLKDEIDNQRQVSDNVNEKQETLEKIKEKNKQIQTLLDELRESEIINLELTNNCKKLKLELKSATNELQISCNQMEMLSKQINQLKQLNEDFLSEKQFLMEEIEKLKQSLNKYENGDQNIIDRYVDNLKDLQNLVKLKDEEIIKLKTSSLIPDQEFKDRQKRMAKELEEKDKQIDLLKSQLNEAVVDMENQTEIIRKLYQQNRGEEEVTQLKEKVNHLTNQLKTIEEEVLTKDEELLTLRKRINTFERGEYGLKDALKEINDLTKHLNNRDQRIEDMVQQMNKLKQELNDAEDAIDGIDSNKKPKNQTKDEKSGDRGKGDKRDKIKILEMERKILELEDEKFALTERLTLKLNQSVVDNQYNREINELKDRLKSIQKENLELQLGMKEILNGIRETDSQSDVIIECPTLERLCKLLEGRSIDSDLTNIIALKAELDLVRGHNEQLRTDIRSMRSDYLKVISQYTQDLLENDIVFGDSSAKNSEEYNSKDIIQNINELQNVFQIKEMVKNDSNEDIQTIESQTNSFGDNTSYFEDKILFDKESQTSPLNDEKVIDIQKIVERMNVSSQTDIRLDLFESNQEINSKEFESKVCENCKKVMKIVDFLKNCIEKLEQNIRSSESKYLQRLEILQTENKNLIESFSVKSKELNQKEIQLNEKEEEINCLQNKLTTTQLTANKSSEDNLPQNEYKMVEYLTPGNNQYHSEVKKDLSSSCKTVLESVINCLQARLEHKDESIRQYRNMLSEAKQNFENEMIRLIESIRENDRKNSINFTQMIDNEELESALKSCVNELELSKTELNSKISQLENELEAKTAKLLIYETENEELRVKRITPTTQLKQTIDELREELKKKDSIINSLSKTIKDDRAMRAGSAQRRSKDQTTSRDKKVDNELFQEIANLRTMTETQKKTINSFEITKWDLEKNLKEARDLLKTKIKEKDIEINELKTKFEKMKIRFNRNENEKQLLQNKILKKENIQRDHKSTQISPQNENDLIKLKNELKKIQKEIKQKESETNALKKDLEVSQQIESELKTLLQESVKREKLATIYEEKSQVDQQLDQLLQENARIKVELRMAEFELRKRSTT